MKCDQKSGNIENVIFDNSGIKLMVAWNNLALNVVIVFKLFCAG